MHNLSFQDAFFLRAESATCPCHVATLMILSPPKGANQLYMRDLVSHLGRIPEVWPVFGQQLSNPTSMKNFAWVEAKDFEAKDHVLHYSLPKHGSMEDLLDLTAHAHEQLLDRSRPLWQVHLIEGLPKGKFAVYFKVHHSLIDGVGGLRLIHEMFSVSPKGRLLNKPEHKHFHRIHTEETAGQILKHAFQTLLKQSKAVPAASSMLANFGLDLLRGKKDRPQLPFSAPHTLLNKELSSRRRFITCELPLNNIQEIGRTYGGTINDVIVAIFGGALKNYLSTLGKLPQRSLDAGLPVSIKSHDSAEGNQLSFIICPLATDEDDPIERLKRIIRATKKAKKDLAHMSPEASEDLATMTMVPFLVMTLTHSSQKLPPVFNTIVSNVPGPRTKIYLEGSLLEHLYPMSIVTDGMGLNFTIISYQKELCIGITSAPGTEPNIKSLGILINKSYKELLSQSIKV